jgi:TonB family protein
MRRAGTLVAVIIVHLGVIAAFIEELDARGALAVHLPLQASIIDLSRPPPPPPILPSVQLQVTPLQTVSLDVPLPVIKLPVVAPVLTSTAVLAPPGPYVPLALLTRPDPDAYYLPSATGHGLSGETLAQVCVDADARLASAQIVKSSGHGELDAAALRMIQQMRWKAATRSGQPVSDCRPLIVTFAPRSKHPAGAGT